MSAFVSNTRMQLEEHALLWCQRACVVTAVPYVRSGVEFPLAVTLALTKLPVWDDLRFWVFS